eukprot:NODE_2028_length_667_cov_125.857407_g1978_i0.p1 GENE.NODE_2028_length_667_cov_125.857407_g1978_i0~~NODE_2028_length_667_cov_125.857407_g1978_i0.p1  ORF type:complete len:182 (+),score=3.26 NODE_2028_length_667_cov_125.857407_g1978_i0:77-622(+)
MTSPAEVPAHGSPLSGALRRAINVPAITGFTGYNDVRGAGRIATAQNRKLFWGFSMMELNHAMKLQRGPHVPPDVKGYHWIAPLRNQNYHTHYRRAGGPAFVLRNWFYRYHFLAVVNYQMFLFFSFMYYYPNREWWKQTTGFYKLVTGSQHKHGTKQHDEMAARVMGLSDPHGHGDGHGHH